MSSKLELTHRAQRRDSTAGEATSDDYYVLDLDSGKYYALGEVGGFIFERLDGSCALRTIAADVCREFEVPATEAEHDLLEFVRSLVDLGLVETGSPE